MTRLIILNNWKNENYDSILVIINQLIKIIYYKLSKIFINLPILVEIIFNVII